MGPADMRQNRLLQLFSDITDRELGSAIRVDLSARDVLQEPDVPVLHAYFPESAVVSLVSTMESGASAEVALVGREGMIGLTGVFGAIEGSTTAVVQVGGTAIRIPAGALRTARLHYPAVRSALDAYTQARFIQVAQTAACSRLHDVDARLARWLLGIHDRIDEDAVVIPQESIAEMLGVHRPTIAVALRRLQAHGVIERQGRAIVIVDRRGLEALACECYAVMERQLERLLRLPATGSTPPAPLALAREPGPGAAAAQEMLQEIAGRLLLASIREQAAREEAEEATRAKDQFLAMVSHELRTPLNAILGWCSVLRDHKDVPTERGLEVIARNARAQLTLVEELLDVARVTSGTLTIRPARISLAETVQAAVEAVAPAASHKQVALRASIARDLPPVFGDPDRLRQVVLNVLTNALKFTGAGGAIDVVAEAAAHHARVTIRDTGAGIPPEVLPHVFDRFRQGAATGTLEGLGLGLTIARTILELHGGTILVTSPGDQQGTTCRIELPFAGAAEPLVRRAAGRP